MGKTKNGDRETETEREGGGGSVHREFETVLSFPVSVTALVPQLVFNPRAEIIRHVG